MTDAPVNDKNWLVESAAPLPTNIVGIPVALVQAHDCYCVCLRDDDRNRYKLALWRKDDHEALFLDATFSEQPLLQIAKASQEHSCWFVYAVDNASSSPEPQLIAWEITARSFLPQDCLQQARTRTTTIPPVRRMNVWPAALHPGKHQDPRITSFTVLQPEDSPKPMLLFGTACGIPLWSTQVSIPMDFIIQKVEATATTKSILYRSLALVQYQPPTTSIVSILPLVSSSGDTNTNKKQTCAFVLVDTTGKLVFWQVMEQRPDPFQQQSDCFVMDLLREHFAPTDSSLYDMHVQDAVAFGPKVYLLCNVQHSNRVESTRYWVVVENDALQGVFHIADTVSGYIMGTNGAPYLLLETDDSNEQSLVTLDKSSDGTLSMASQSLVNTKLYSGIMCPDHTTHGVLLMPKEGPALLRARFASMPNMVPQDNELPIPSVREIETLRSLFETWYTATADSNGLAAISVTLQNPYILAAVLPLAQSVSQTFRNPMERHLAYLRFLQDVGLYKFLPETTKWSLLAIGQNLQVSQSQQLASLSESSSVSPETIGDYLVSAQRSQSSTQWLNILHATLKAARDHREKYGPPQQGISYDIVNAEQAIPGLLWTSSILASVLEPQLSAWDSLPNGIPDISEYQPYLEIFQWMLEAYRDHGEVDAYGHASKRVFSIVRLTFGKRQDKWLFQLCRDHRYYDGLLIIHSGYVPCDSFSLTRIEGNLETDIETNMPFKHYALKWLAEHENTIGRALSLHTEWADEFYEVAETTASLKPYQWMVDVVRENHDKVAEELLQRASTDKDMTLVDAGVVLGAAHSSNELVKLDDAVNRERAKKRTDILEKKQDLLQVLYRFQPTPQMFLSSKDAFNKAMKQIVGESVSNNIDHYSTALEICLTFDSNEDAMNAALLVWTKALLADKETWLQWINRESDLTAPHIQEEIRKSTMFGQLMDFGEELLSENSVVAWTNAWDKLENLDDLFTHVQLRRLIATYCTSRGVRDVQMTVAQ